MPIWGPTAAQLPIFDTFQSLLMFMWSDAGGVNIDFYHN
jgi:hypothetical protein